MIPHLLNNSYMISWLNLLELWTSISVKTVSTSAMRFLIICLSILEIWRFRKIKWNKYYLEVFMVFNLILASRKKSKNPYRTLRLFPLLLCFMNTQDYWKMSPTFIIVSINSKTYKHKLLLLWLQTWCSYVLFPWSIY